MLTYTKTFSSFSVDDLPKAKEFYTKILGLDVTETKEGLDVTLKDASLFIYPKQNHVPATFTVLNFMVDDIDVSVDALTELGVMFEHYATDTMKTDEKGIQRGYGPSIAWFKDPAGNFISVVSNNK